MGAFLVDQVGSWSYNVVVIVYVSTAPGHRPGSPRRPPRAGCRGSSCPTYAGVLADRSERTRVLVVSALAPLALIALIAVMAVVIAVRVPVLLALVLAALVAAGGTTYHPAAQALIPDVVHEDELASANGLFAGREILVVVLGPAVGGSLLLAAEPMWGIVVNAVTFLVAALLVSRVRTRSHGSAGNTGSLRAQVADGFEALRSTPLAVTVVAFCARGTAVYGASTVLYVPTSEQLGTGSEGYSYLLAGAPLGGVAVAGLVNPLSSLARLAPVILGRDASARPAVRGGGAHPLPGGRFVLQVLSGAGMVGGRRAHGHGAPARAAP